LERLGQLNKTIFYGTIGGGEEHVLLFLTSLLYTIFFMNDEQNEREKNWVQIGNKLGKITINNGVLIRKY
jgi:hypothetical protein